MDSKIDSIVFSFGHGPTYLHLPTKSLHAASSVNRPCSTSVVKTVVIGSGARCAVPPAAGCCVKNLCGRVIHRHP